jgi:hypothetical protein
MTGLVQPFTIGEDIEFLHPGGKIDSKLRQSLESRVRISALYLQQMNVYIDRYENVCLPIVYEHVFYVWEARSTSKGESWGSDTYRHPSFATHQHVYYHIMKYINTYIKILHIMNMHIHTLYEHKGKIDTSKAESWELGAYRHPLFATDKHVYQHATYIMLYKHTTYYIYYKHTNHINILQRMWTCMLIRAYILCMLTLLVELWIRGRIWRMFFTDLMWCLLRYNYIMMQVLPDHRVFRRRRHLRAQPVRHVPWNVP